MAQLKVLICGGGIAGNALAFWLSKMGHEVTVIERFPNLRATGLQVDLRGHGIEVMRRMGLEQDFRAQSVKEQGLRIVDSSGREWAYFPANRSGKGPQSFTTDFEIMRGDLCRLLYNSTKDRVKYVFGTTVEDFTENDTSIEVRFSNGNTEMFDLLVGADGQGSRIRRMMLGPSAQDPFHPLGAYIAYFTVPQPIKEGEKYAGTVYIAPGRRFLFTRRNDPYTIQAYLTCVTDSERMKNCQKGDVIEEKKVIAEIFRGAQWQTERLVKSMEDADDFYCERLGLVKLDTWSSGRVALLGDAAYCPSATTGMGTTSAIVGAYVLAGEIGKYCGQPGKENIKTGLARALKAYEQVYRPFMDQVQHGLTEDSSPWRMLPSTTLGIYILNIVLAVSSFLRFDVIAKFFLREEVKDWALPKY